MLTGVAQGLERRTGQSLCDQFGVNRKTIKRWLIKKHEKRKIRWLYAQYGWCKPGGKTIRWQDGDVRPFEMVSLRVERFRHAWQTPPSFAISSMESPVHSERCTLGSARGERKPTRGQPG